MARSWWKSNKNNIYIITASVLFFLAIGIVLFFSFQNKEANYADLCEQTCYGFGLKYHSSEENYNENDRCWCLKDGLPYEIPVN